jgi:Response regulators consisting of a CheY-like receiver domain and a winged-helix DNA-binding domain
VRLLIIEDNIELSQTMRDGLTSDGFTVDVSNTGKEGEEKAFVNAYDVILLDLNLPDKDGLDILRFLRSENIPTPVVIITARNEIRQRALGLNLGADDYVLKPFDFTELSARIRAVVRRAYGRASPEIRIGQLIVNPQTRSVLYDEKQIALSAKEFDILEYVTSAYPAMVPSEAIAEHVYDEFADPFSSVLRVHIANLRKKLKNASGQDLLVTNKGKGYSIWPGED